MTRIVGLTAFMSDLKEDLVLHSFIDLGSRACI